MQHSLVHDLYGQPVVLSRYQRKLNPCMDTVMPTHTHGHTVNSYLAASVPQNEHATNDNTNTNCAKLHKQWYMGMCGPDTADNHNCICSDHAFMKCRKLAVMTPNWTASGPAL